MKAEVVELKKGKTKTQFPKVHYNPSLDKYEGKKVSTEKMASILESLKKPGFPGIISSNK